MASFVIDDKFIKETKSNNAFVFKLIRLLSRVYKPIALARMKTNFHYFMIEYWIWQQLLKVIPGMIGRAQGE